MSKPRLMIKEEAHQLVEKMPADSTWDDLIEQIYARAVIELGLADSQANRVTEVKEIRAEYGLPE